MITTTTIYIDSDFDDDSDADDDDDHNDTVIRLWYNDSTDSIDCTYMIKIMITMTMTRTKKLNKMDYDNKNNITRQKHNDVTMKQLHITKLTHPHLVVHSIVVLLLTL